MSECGGGLMLANVVPFYRFLREERVFCSVLAHLLMHAGDNLCTFLELLNAKLPAELRIPTSDLEEAEIYPEFSFLRDRWFALGRDNQRKRDLIAALLGALPTLDLIDTARLPRELAEFNACFAGERGRRITRDIVYPGQWTIA